MVRPIKLINTDTATVDSIGQIVEAETTTDLIAEISSISQSEFMQSGQIGLKPEYRFKIWQNEYNNQKIVEYNGLRYSVYRTFFAKDGRIELYTEARTGENYS